MFELSQIYEIATGIDEHCKKLTSCIHVMKEIRDSINAIKEREENKSERELEKLRCEITELTQTLQRHGLNLPTEYERNFNLIKESIFGGEWPEAVPDELICDEDAKVQKRAEDILDVFIAEDLQGKSFLDFGCGKGQVVTAAKERGARVSFGYDISKTWKDSEDGSLFSDNFDAVKENGPFDIILLYDVIDHTNNPLEALSQISSVLSRKGRVYVKCHPWCSRHGTHLYEHINKAFLHLVLDEVELTRLGGYSNEPTLRVTHPLVAYKEWFKQTELNIDSEMVQVTEVDGFFKENIFVWDKIKLHWPDDSFPENCMRIDFIDYVLTKDESEQIF